MLSKESPLYARVSATIDPRSIETDFHGDKPDFDAELAGPSWLDAAKFPKITFKSTKVEPNGDKEAKVTGDLTLNGVTKEVVLDVDLNQMAAHPMTGKEAVGFDAETEIKRTDFNLGQFAPAVEDEVEINISVEAIKAE